MKNLLYHVSDKKVNILDPAKTKDGRIYLSEGCFIGYFGQWLYIFEREVLETHFTIKEIRPGSSLAFDRRFSGPHEKEKRYAFKSRDLERELYIEDPIDVRFALGIAENYNALKGEFTKIVGGVVESRELLDLKKELGID